MKKGRGGKQLGLFGHEVSKSNKTRNVAGRRDSRGDGARVVAEARGRHSSVVVGKTDSGGKYVAFLCGGRASRKRSDIR